MGIACGPWLVFCSSRLLVAEERVVRSKDSCNETKEPKKNGSFFHSKYQTKLILITLQLESSFICAVR